MDKNQEQILQLLEQIKGLKGEVQQLKDESPIVKRQDLHTDIQANPDTIPPTGHNQTAVEKMIDDRFGLDFNPRLNTSSYVNVMLDSVEKRIALKGLEVNLADQTVYPQSYKIHDTVVNMVAKLWNCPPPEHGGQYSGAGTVGSTEACLLAGLALKFRWRSWYSKKYGLSQKEVLAERPNLIISSCFQAAWEKLFKYMDIECRILPTQSTTFKMDSSQLEGVIDDHTIGVVCIMGNHYAGQYDPIQEVDQVISLLNEKNNWQVGIHVDAASGGFIAPFQKSLAPWDFRLPNVLSISSSGHKYGESCCGTGWVVWRHRKDLSEHVAVKITYLGGEADSLTLNFSRPASGVYVQYYKFLRYGHSGYEQSCEIMMQFAARIRHGLSKMQHQGQSRFIFLDDGDENCLPVVAARLNPACHLPYDDVDLQNVLTQHHWYVSAYRMGYEDPLEAVLLPLFTDQPKEAAMFRVVVKVNFSNAMVDHLLSSFEESLAFLDKNFSGPAINVKTMGHKDRKFTAHC
ncbi:pyridoxal-dependent decarboxylase [Gammaproteobacteria bacterium]|nr:pyridoxal-dependent decarboxylase [Gammaproteobacteria bacterium]